MLGQLSLSNKVFIGAGAIKTLEDVLHASQIPDLSLILIGSYTVPEKPGNDGETYYYDNHTRTSLNSIGLRNGGKPYLIKNLAKMVRIANDAGKILGLSVSGETPEENAELIQLGIMEGVQYFEVNTACGNVINGETNRSKPIACYNHFAMERMFEVLSGIYFDKDKHYKTFKVGKYLNFTDIEGLAELHKQYNLFDGIVTTNTEKSTILGPDGSPVITPDNGFGGLGGKPLKPGALGQVYKWFHALFPMDVIGVGGIFTGEDVMDYENYGASAMQYTTSYLKNGKPDRDMQGIISADYLERCENLR